MKYFNENEKQYMKQYGFQVICTKAKRKGYICECGNGSGADGTGLVSKDKIHYTCFKCGFYGDIFDYVGKVYGLNKMYDRQVKTAELMRLDDSYKDYKTINKSILLQVKEDTQEQKLQKLQKTKQENEYLYCCTHNRLKSQFGSESRGYLYNRGINDKTIDKFKIGCLENNNIILPITFDFYIERSIKEKKYFNRCADGIKLFRNFTYNQLNDNDIVLVCEGVFDSMIALQLNIFDKVISLNSVNNKNKLYEFAKQCRSKNIIYVVQLDVDDAGREAQEEIYKTLTDDNIQCIDSQAIALIQDKQAYKTCKDINDCYMNNIALTRKYLLKAYNMAIKLKQMIA